MVLRHTVLSEFNFDLLRPMEILLSGMFPGLALTSLGSGSARQRLPRDNTAHSINFPLQVTSNFNFSNKGNFFPRLNPRCTFLDFIA